MKKSRLIVRIVVLSIILVALGSAFYQAITNDDSPVRVGHPAPDFELRTLDGDMVRLSDYRGQGVFINFWASWCGPCREEMPDMEQQYQLMKDEGLEILAVNIAESDVVAGSFANRLGLTFPILLDRDRLVNDRYGVGPIPVSIFVDKDGMVVSKVERMMSEAEMIENIRAILPDQ